MLSGPRTIHLTSSTVDARAAVLMQPADSSQSAVPLWQSVLLAALAGGMAWGIRGQYGHETGAMLAGLLIGLALTLLYCPGANSLAAARVVALCTVAMGFGGSETYAVTVGLTHDKDLIGNWAALRWGMLGLAIKGGVWIGFAGVFLGMGLSGIRYRSREMLLVMLGMFGISFLGVWLFNQPYRPSEKIFPLLYFSDSWIWNQNLNSRPRREAWGGLVCPLAALIVYVWTVRRDSLAMRLGLWGVLGGALGFPLGQCLQAYHAWNPEIFQSGIWIRLDPIINWWNFMETTFGTVMGATLGLGVWLNRHRISVAHSEPEVTIRPWAEILLMIVHITLLISTEFGVPSQLSQIYGFGLVLGLIPVVAIVGGKWWPYWLLLPITTLPIAGKTLRNLTYEEKLMPVDPGWVFYFVLPLIFTAIAAAQFASKADRNRAALPFLRSSLLLTTWLFFILNLAFFRYPWPWWEWTRRTPNAFVFTVCALGLTVFALTRRETAVALSSPGDRPAL